MGRASEAALGEWVSAPRCLSCGEKNVVDHRVRWCCFAIWRCRRV